MHHRPPGPPLSARITGCTHPLVTAPARRVAPHRAGAARAARVRGPGDDDGRRAGPGDPGRLRQSGPDPGGRSWTRRRRRSATRSGNSTGGDGPRRAAGDHVGERVLRADDACGRRCSRRRPDVLQDLRTPAAPGSAPDDSPVGSPSTPRPPSVHARDDGAGQPTTGSPSSLVVASRPLRGRRPGPPRRTRPSRRPSRTTPPLPPPRRRPSSTRRRRCSRCSNADRAAEGCDALVADDGLASAAQAHSAAMSADGELGLDGLGSGAAVVARPAERALRRRGLAGRPDRQRGGPRLRPDVGRRRRRRRLVDHRPRLTRRRSCRGPRTPWAGAEDGLRRGPLARAGARGPRRAALPQAMAFCRLASMAARKSWVVSHGLSWEISSARSLVI